MTQSEIVEEMEFLTRSEIRPRLLRALRGGGRSTRTELRREFDVSRTTLQRNLNALAERGWIRNANNQYWIAPCGAMIADGFDSFHETMCAAERLRPSLRWISPEDLDVALADLADAEVVVSDPSDPYAPVNTHVEALKTAERVRAVLPSVGRDAVEVAAGRIEAGHARYELVVSEGCLDVLLEDPKYTRYVNGMLDSRRFSVAVTDREIPYYLGVLDESVQIGVEDADGIPRALVETDAESVRAWADRTVSSYSEDARPVTAASAADG